MTNVFELVIWNISLIILAFFPVLMLYVDIDGAEGMEYPTAIILFMNICASNKTTLFLSVLYFLTNLILFIVMREKIKAKEVV